MSKISERDMLDTAEYIIDLFDNTKPPEEQVAEGVTKRSVQGEWMKRARQLVEHRKAQYIDNSRKKG